MYVRQLQLQGFKTFASKTAFEFAQGITAVVGPNGSGKSNLADALRWVLGEQSYSTLRSRRTEDVIFSGSSVRSPLGMAEVSLLLDNEDAYFPIDFPEVEITRRAYRSGTNEYLLNRRRVRLQDIEEVLGGLTSSYVVIHQGLVDEALSLRPRERRLLLEEAAEVRRYHERRQKAQERLARTSANMTRISDLRSELGPRLRVLERQSHQARQRAKMEASLHQALRSWYRLLWEDASTEREQALREEQEAQSALERARTALQQAEGEAARLRQAVQEARHRQEAEHRREAELRRQEAELRQQLAQVEGEQRALGRYHQELQAEISHWEEEAGRQEERARALESERQAVGLRLEAAQADLQAREEASRQAEAALQLARGSLQEMQQQLRARDERAREAERRLDQVATRLEALAHEEEERAGLLHGLQEQAGRLRDERGECAAELDRQESLWRDLRARGEAVQQEVSAAEEALHQAGAALEQSRLRLADTRARAEALAHGGGQEDGMAFLQEWARREGRPPLRSPLAHLTVPAGLEQAVEAALEATAAPLLAADWGEGEAAVGALMKEGAGRAALLPQHEAPPPSTGPGEPLPPGCEGLLLEHLTVPPQDLPALTALLGRIVLAADLASARAAAHSLPAGWHVVTREGHSLSSSGLLRGGHFRPHGSLDRERERLALEQAATAAEAACREAERATAAARQRRDEAQAARIDLDRRSAALAGQRDELARRTRELERDIAHNEEEAARHARRLQALREERARLADERASLHDALRQSQAEPLPLHSQVAQAQQAEQAAQSRCDQARDRLQEARTAWAVARKEWESQRALEEMAGHSSTRLSQQIAEGRQRLQEALDQQTAWGERATALRAELTQVGTSLATVLAAAAPLAVPLDELGRCEEQVARHRQEVLEAESAAARAAMETQRRHDHLRELLRRALADIGPEASAYGPAGEALLNALIEDPPEWARAPLDPALSGEEMERRIAHLREEARRIGPVNPLAEEEYRQAQERYEFLGQQLQDMHDAVRSLEQVIAELDQAMEERFRDTFEAINREFQAYFSRLFAGGTASLRLVKMEEDEDGGLSGLGVEIVARPPGKRAHSLALLSGGERALTSAALLFAILKVNPRPFCLLDEVDAMLDEANVGRFRECLEELAQHTQFIVITHNRGTVQAAHTLYGVSMAEDGSSRVLSLRLEEVGPQPGAVGG